MENISGQLRMEQISKSFGPVQALKNVTFCAKPGKVHALCGENGAGKSTLMKVLAGVFLPDSGKIFIDDQHKTFTNPRQALDTARDHHHTARQKGTRCNGRRQVLWVVDDIGQIDNVGHPVRRFDADVEPGRLGHHQVRLHVGYRAQVNERPNAVEDARRATDADHNPLAHAIPPIRAVPLTRSQ